MRPVVFVGPSIALDEARELLDADFRRPCERGDLVRIDSGTVVGIIDGVFDQTRAVSPREIVYAINRGVLMFGSSSMGALRAAEIPTMRGIGRAYEMYRDGLIDSDDEVAVAFDPERLVAVTVPLVNVRYAVERLRQSDTITENVAARLVDAAKALHYTERTYRRILADAGLLNKADSKELLDLLSSIDLKRDDARVLLEHIAALKTTATLAAERPGSTPGGALPQPPDYGRADGFGSVVAPGRTEAERPMLLWRSCVESGGCGAARRRLLTTCRGVEAPTEHVWHTATIAPVSNNVNENAV